MRRQRTALRSTAFTYQGRLTDNASPANGSYDLPFILFDEDQFGFPVGPILTKGNLAVDADGVALAAIQGLNEKVEVGNQGSESRIQKLEAESAELKQRLEKLEHLLTHTPDGDGN